MRVATISNQTGSIPFFLITGTVPGAVMNLTNSFAASGTFAGTGSCLGGYAESASLPPFL